MDKPIRKRDVRLSDFVAQVDLMTNGISVKAELIRHEVDGKYRFLIKDGPAQICEVVTNEQLIIQHILPYAYKVVFAIARIAERNKITVK